MFNLVEKFNQKPNQTVNLNTFYTILRAIQNFFIMNVFNFNKDIEIDLRANYIFDRNNNVFVFYFNTIIAFCFFIDFDALRFLVKSNELIINLLYKSF